MFLIEADTDGDGIPDNKEILQQEYVYCAEDDNEEAVIKSIAINTACNGDLAEQVWIESCNEETVKGMVGKMFDISVDAEFETATVTFTYTEELLGSTKEEDLCVLWYDEEQDIYDILDDVCVVDTEKNTVTYETTYFSKYLLVDKQIWYDTWRENPNYRSHEEPVYYNVALTVDVLFHL